MRLLYEHDRTLHPIFAAGLMGAVVALSLLWTHKGIHVSGVFALLCPAAATSSAADANASSCSIHGPALDKGWIAWMIAGMVIGAFFTALWRNRGFRFAIERGRAVRPASRLVLAAAGGLVVGFGSALAGGCTSSIGLTGSALFSVAALAFLGVFFVGGFAARVFFGRFWRV